VYLTPDVAVRLDTVRLEDDGPDRVRISGTRGEPPPARLKVCVNELGGHRNAVELALVGTDVEAKAAWVREQLTAALGDRAPESVEWTLVRGREDAATQEEASARLRCAVRDADPDAVGRRFSNAVVELALASYPGFQLTAPPASGTPFGVYRAGYVDRGEVEHVAVHADGRREPVPDPPATAEPAPAAVPATAAHVTHHGRRVPLGTVAHARSGDKGGDANIGVWPRRDRAPGPRAAWLRETLTSQRIRELLPEAAGCDVEVHPLPNLGAVNVVLHGLLGEGVAASGRFDPQAKGLAEWLRAQPVEVPEELL